jgi:predicted DCC family thiol-disulfide oxidoreductase YuxK
MAIYSCRWAKVRPTLVYEGDCGVCSRIAESCRTWTGGSVDILSSMDAAKRFSAISPTLDAVRLVKPQGDILKGAKAIFAVLESAGKSWPLRFYQSTPAFAAISESIYSIISRRHRILERFLRRLFLSNRQRNIGFLVSGLLGLAFVSFILQNRGLKRSSY